MDTVFCEVSARLSPEYVKIQTQHFEFAEFLHNICKQLDIALQCYAKSQYTLIGEWFSLTKANDILLHSLNKKIRMNSSEVQPDENITIKHEIESDEEYGQAAIDYSQPQRLNQQHTVIRENVEKGQVGQSDGDMDVEKSKSQHDNILKNRSEYEYSSEHKLHTEAFYNKKIFSYHDKIVNNQNIEDRESSCDSSIEYTPRVENCHNNGNNKEFGYHGNNETFGYHGNNEAPGYRGDVVNNQASDEGELIKRNFNKALQEKGEIIYKIPRGEEYLTCVVKREFDPDDQSYDTNRVLSGEGDSGDFKLSKSTTSDEEIEEDGGDLKDGNEDKSSTTDEEDVAMYIVDETADQNSDVEKDPKDVSRHGRGNKGKLLKKIKKVKIFKCGECDFVTNKLKLLKEHENVKHKDKESKCDICGKLFKCKRYLRKHRVRHFHKDICNVCGKGFKNADTLKKHQKHHEKQIDLLCYLCNKLFPNQTDMDNHFKVDHPQFDDGTKVLSVLDDCVEDIVRKISGNSEDTKVDNAKGKTNESKPREDQTKPESDNNKSMPLFTKIKFKFKGTAMDKDGKTIEICCPECDYKTTKRSSLRHHFRLIHRGKPTNCNVCGKLFSNERYMRKHRALHFSALHLCDICGKAYKEPKVLQRHKLTHMEGYTPQEFQCDYCDKKYLSKFSIDNHVRVEHFGEARKGGLCSICGKDFVSKSRLAEHFNTHTGIKPYTCDICHKSFIYASCLRSHKWTHENKAYPCEKCDKVFKLKRSMIKHLQKHAPVQVSFKCTICDKNFVEKGTLKRHEMIHSGSKPFCCRLCGQTFNQGSIIRRHLSIVHKIDKPKETWREDIQIIPQLPIS